VSVYQIVLDERAEDRLTEVKTGFKLASDRGAFIVAISLAAELSHHVDSQGCINLLDGSKIRVRDVE
jgi:hypothetical protein